MINKLEITGIGRIKKLEAVYSESQGLSPVCPSIETKRTESDTGIDLLPSGEDKLNYLDSKML